VKILPLRFLYIQNKIIKLLKGLFQKNEINVKCKITYLVLTLVCDHEFLGFLNDFWNLETTSSLPLKKNSIKFKIVTTYV